MGLFAFIVSENGLEYIDVFWLFINYRPNGTKSIKQTSTLIGIMEFENITIDNDSPSNSLFPSVSACQYDNTNFIFHKISCVCISEWSLINQSHYWRPFPPCCAAPCLSKEANSALSSFTSITAHSNTVSSEAFKQPPYAISAPAFLTPVLMQNDWCHLFRVKEGGKQRREGGGRKDGIIWIKLKDSLITKCPFLPFQSWC